MHCVRNVDNFFNLMQRLNFAYRLFELSDCRVVKTCANREGIATGVWTIDRPICPFQKFYKCSVETTGSELL